MKKILLFGLITLATLTKAFSQVSGKVVDESNNSPLIGATVVVSQTGNGTVTDVNGDFRVNASEGDELEVSFIGYASVKVNAKNGMVIKLTVEANQLSEIVVSSGIIDIAKTRETPIAVSTISVEELTLKMGNQEFPEIMNKTPGVYSTKQGGGYGDSRISLRGFDQTNTAFLINGQPVNDMENGALYWSNWQGLSDVASGIQIQRGLGASRLAVPSVGGTVSIFTKAAQAKKGGAVTQMIGNDGYSKTAGSFNTGLNDKGWAVSGLLSYWRGNGYVYNTSGEGLNYFFALGYQPEGSNHAVNFSFLGAAQWHHQRYDAVSIRDYEYFGDEGIDQRWNSNGGTLNGEEFSMRRNFYNKPLATLNWDWEITDNLKLVTSLYGSAGRGGGTGPRGKNFENQNLDISPNKKDLYEHYVENGRGLRNPDGSINFDAVIAENTASTTGYSGSIEAFQNKLVGSNGFEEDGVNRATIIRRVSMNSHNWVGGISNLEYESGMFKYSIGVDLRKYTGYHYRTLTHLMGLDGYFSTGNQNSTGLIIETTVKPSPFNDAGLNAPKLDRNNIGHVGWQGVNGLVEYNNKSTLTAVLQGGVSNQSFQREDFFAQPGNPLSDKKNVLGGYIKGGANYNLSSKSNLFFNAGYISRQPNFDAVFPNYANEVNKDLQNEKITSFELGYGYNSSKLTANVNAYYTTWGNRFITRSLLGQGSAEGTAQFKNIDVLHSGIEIEATYKANNKLQFRGMISAGNWEYTKNFTAEIFDDSQNSIGTGTLYMDGVKVGDAAQFTSYFEADYRVGKFNFDLGYRFVDNLYADYNINDEEFTNPDNKGALKLPSFGLVDFGSSFKFNLFGNEAVARLNVNNLFDTVYIAESETNVHAESGAETWNGIDKSNSVWFGFGRTWNFSLRYTF